MLNKTNKKMKKVRAAIVGYGNIGRYVLEALQAAPDFEIAGVVRRAGAENKPAELNDYAVVKDIKELQGVDVAILCTPTRSVEKYAKEILTNLGVYTIVIAQIVYAVVMCLLNDRSIKKYMGYKNPWRSAYLSPFLAAIPMGVVAGVVYYGLYALIHSNVICLGISVMLAAGVYFIVYLFVSKPGEDELGMMPGGRYMKKLARMMKII